MESKEKIKPVLTYINLHLQESLSLEKIAEYMGYSKYHFLRVFKECMGMTVMEYVNKRCLLKASEEIFDGAGILDTAVKYGWQSHSGFSKAFKREYGFSPSLLKLMGEEINQTGGVVMNHKFLQPSVKNATKEDLLKIWKARLQQNKIHIKESLVNRIYHCACRAYEKRFRYSGDEYVIHPLNVAILLTELNATWEVICAGMFCDVVKKGNMPLKQLKRELPPEIAQLVQESSEWDFTEEKLSSPVTLIKLAERLHNMRTIEVMSEQQKKERAEETIRIFLPIAEKLKIEKISTELNNLAMRYL